MNLLGFALLGVSDAVRSILMNGPFPLKDIGDVGGAQELPRMGNEDYSVAFRSAPPWEFCNIQQQSLWMIILCPQDFISLPSSLAWHPHALHGSGNTNGNVQIRSSQISKGKHSSLSLSLRRRSCWMLWMSHTCRRREGSVHSTHMLVCATCQGRALPENFCRSNWEKGVLGFY